MPKHVREHRRKFVLCVRNAGHEASLELRKLYSVIRDPTASSRRLIRVVDESGEDYLYPEVCFVRVKLPPRVKQALLVGS